MGKKEAARIQAENKCYYIATIKFVIIVEETTTLRPETMKAKESQTKTIA